MKLSIRDMILVAIFAALTAVGAFIKIPIPYVPVTLQFFFSAFAGVILGARKGALSQIVYVLVGLIGFPVFTKGGGLLYIFEPTFGFIIGFIANAYLIGKILESCKRLNILKIYTAILAGLLSIYVIGVPYFYMIYNLYLRKTMTVHSALKYAFLPFIWKDILVGLVVAVITAAVMPRLNKALHLGKDNF